MMFSESFLWHDIKSYFYTYVLSLLLMIDVNASPRLLSAYKC